MAQNGREFEENGDDGFPEINYIHLSNQMQILMDLGKGSGSK